MDASERERALRRRFGPPLEDSRPPARRRLRPPHPSARVVGLFMAAVVVTAGAVGAFALTPRDHVAPGCFWWTARTVGAVNLGQRGCVRGVVTTGGYLAESGDPGSPVLPLLYADPDATPRLTCPFRPADSVVVRYHTAFDDGRTLIVVDGCR